MLQSILYQLLEATPSSYDAIANMFHSLQVSRQSSHSPVWDVTSLKTALIVLLEKACDSLNIVCFLDALDEHAGDNVLLVELIRDMERIQNPSLRLKVCLASRQWTVFKNAFDGHPNLEIHKYTRHDIANYTREKLTEVLEVRSSNSFFVR